MKNEFTTVIDAGGRYGLHPSWKKFSGELNYHLFEPDKDESNRLSKKYINRPDIIVSDLALSDKKQTLRLYHLHNSAMSTCNTRNKIVSWFKQEREHEEDVVGYSDVESTTIDGYCKNNNIDVDFLKLDTEGSEYEILKGSELQLTKNILGVRSEVSFDNIFENSALFSTMHDFMLDHGYYLLNIDYDGKGDFKNPAVNCNGKYGVLMYCDAVWLRRIDWLFDSMHKDTVTNTIKYAVFCINNNAVDVALEVLLSAKNDHNINFSAIVDTKLYNHLDYLIHKHFYGLKWQPGQLISNHQKIYYNIFGKKMLETQEYNQSNMMNPT